MRSLPRFMVVATIAGVVASMNIRADLPPEHDGQFTPNAPGEPRLCRLYFDPIRPASLKNPRKAFHGLSPEEIVDIVADMGTEMWAGGITWNGSPFGGDYQGVWFPSEMVRQSEKVPFEHIQRVVKRAKEYGIIYQGCQQLSDVENQDLEGNMIDWAIHPLGGGGNPIHDGSATRAKALRNGLLATWLSI